MEGIGFQKIFITGANGWLGRMFLETLIKGNNDFPEIFQPDPNIKIHCLLLPDEDASFLKSLNKNIILHYGDMSKKEDVISFLKDAKASIVICLAGLIHPKKIKELYQVNTTGTLNIVEEATKNGATKCIVISSNSPCGNNPTRTHRFTEESSYHPYMNYGKSKMMMETGAIALCKNTSTTLCILRPCWFYGPFQPERQSLFFRMIRDGKGPILGNGESYRSMSFVGNVVQGIILAAQKNIPSGSIYWIADKHPYTMNEITDTIESLLEKEFGMKCKKTRMKLPSIFSEIAMVVDFMLQSLGLYEQKIHVLSEMNKTIACSIEKAERELGFVPKISLEEGMRRSIQDLLNRKGEL